MKLKKWQNGFCNKNMEYNTKENLIDEKNYIEKIKQSIHNLKKC